MLISLRIELQSITKVLLPETCGTKVPVLEENNMIDQDDLVLPTTVDELVKLLNTVYPEKSPNVKDKVNEIYFQSGQRDVVKFINTLKERTEK